MGRAHRVFTGSVGADLPLAIPTAAGKTSTVTLPREDSRNAAQKQVHHVEQSRVDDNGVARGIGHRLGHSAAIWAAAGDGSDSLSTANRHGSVRERRGLLRRGLGVEQAVANNSVARRHENMVVLHRPRPSVVGSSRQHFSSVVQSPARAPARAAPSAITARPLRARATRLSAAPILLPCC